EALKLLYLILSAPFLSNTKVSRPGTIPNNEDLTPNVFLAILFSSDRNINVRLYCLENLLCDFEESELMAITSAPKSLKSLYWSLKSQASVVQPGVKFRG